MFYLHAACQYIDAAGSTQPAKDAHLMLKTWLGNCFDSLFAQALLFNVASAAEDRRNLCRG